MIVVMMITAKEKIAEMMNEILKLSDVSSFVLFCYDPSYAPMLIAMLMTMLMAMFLTIADRSSLGYRVVPKPTLFRVSLCSSEPYR